MPLLTELVTILLAASYKDPTPPEPSSLRDNAIATQQVSAYWLKPWAIIFNRFRLRPISPFSYVGQVAAKSDIPLGDEPLIFDFFQAFQAWLT
jgi:hypothetical protein